MLRGEIFLFWRDDGITEVIVERMANKGMQPANGTIDCRDIDEFSRAVRG
jgi:hypothetical protein